MNKHVITIKKTIMPHLHQVTLAPAPPGVKASGDPHVCGVCGGHSEHGKTVNGIVWCSDLCFTRLMIGRNPEPAKNPEATPAHERSCCHCGKPGATWRDDDGFWFCGLSCFGQASGLPPLPPPSPSTS